VRSRKILSRLEHANGGKKEAVTAGGEKKWRGQNHNFRENGRAPVLSNKKINEALELKTTPSFQGYDKAREGGKQIAKVTEGKSIGPKIEHHLYS